MSEAYPKIYLYKRIVQAKLFMDEHYGENIDLDNISDEACFSKFHFIRLFKSIYGKTPHQYVTKVRIDKAMLFLQKGTAVTDACFAVGFDSLSSFTGLFRRYTSLSPTAYRRQHLMRQEQIKSNPLQFIPNCFAQQKRLDPKKQF